MKRVIKNNKRLTEIMDFNPRIIALLMFVFFSTHSLFSQITTANSGSNLQYVVPAGVTSIKVEVWGGGGRGGSVNSTTGQRGGGGGGAYSSSTLMVSPGTTFYYSVGAGSTSNDSGGDTWFTPTSNSSAAALVLAKGGGTASNSNSQGANGGSYSDGKGDVRNNGGRGANGSSSYGGGGGGSSAGSAGTGINAVNNFGAVGALGTDGNGGNGGTGDNDGITAGSGPGAGGGGASRITSESATGGSGANGRIIITVLGPRATVTATGAQTWTVPAGVTSIEVEAWGAGGRGGSSNMSTPNNVGAAGGGGGGYSRSIISVTPGTMYYINVGAGSTSGSTSSSTGDSWFSPNSDGTNPSVLAKVGNSVSAGNLTRGDGGSTSGAVGSSVRLAGGNGWDGGSTSGGGGSSAGTESAGVSATNRNGAAAPLGGGSGGNGGVTGGNNAGSAGTVPGGGGGGAFKLSNSSTGGSGGNGQVIVNTFYNVSIAKTVNTSTPLVGSTITFTITVTNNTTAYARGVSVLDQLPSGLSHSSNTGGGNYNVGTGVWTIPDLGPGGVASLGITALVLTSGNYANTATLRTNISNRGNNSSTITLFPQQPTTNLQLTKQVNNAMPVVGSNVTFTLKALNAGPQAATGVKVADILPFGFTHVSNSGGYDAGTGVWTIGSLASGISQNLTLVAKVNAFGNYYNEATISGDQLDPDMNNNKSGINVYPIYPVTEVVLPCGSTTYNLNSFSIATPPSGSVLSWHAASPATGANKIATPTNVKAGQRYYVAYYDSSDNCYSSTSEVKITKSCLITNPMIYQRTK